MKSFFTKEESRKAILVILFIALIINVLHGQNQKTCIIKGQLKDQHSMQVLPFATVVLRRTADSTLVNGALSSETGEFRLISVPAGNYFIEASSIGYDPARKYIDLTGDYDAGDLFMKEKSISLGEVVIEGERVKTKTDPDRTTYFINKKMYAASDNGADMLKYIPGVQVDLMKNISLQGSKHIIILVDGKERDMNFLSQLSPDKIDKIEIINSPDPKYDADVTGVINVILKKEKAPGLGGNIHAEIPTSSSEIYLFPSYTFNYTTGKLSIFSSYNGAMSYFRNIETSLRDFQGPSGHTSISSEQVMRQKDWSHRFHYGFDYALNAKNELSFYAFNNPYSNELDGTVDMKISTTDTNDKHWSALKEDSDINHASYYSANFRHDFAKPGRSILFDLGYFTFSATNIVKYTPTQSSPEDLSFGMINSLHPNQHSLNFKADFSSPLNEKVKIDAGIKVRTQVMSDRLSSNFSNSENIYAIYGTAAFTRSAYTLVTGLRAEESGTVLAGGAHTNILSLLPNAVLNFKLHSKQNLKFSYSRAVDRPNIYQLNPYLSSDDPYSVESGNPGLKPEYFQSIAVEYSLKPRNNFLALQLYYNKRSDAISHYTFVNDTGIVETHTANLGKIDAYGFQVTGALKLGKSIAVNPYARLSYLRSSGNSITSLYKIGNISRLVLETSLSAIVTFRHELTASFQFQYSSPQVDIQGISFSDALFLFSAEKVFRQRFRIGITSALPLIKKFTYQGTEIKGENYYCHSEGNLRLSAFPLWIKLGYQFNPGKKASKMTEARETEEVRRKKGF
jgi:outer membrane cobalamin receptor